MRLKGSVKEERVEESEREGRGERGERKQREKERGERREREKVERGLSKKGRKYIHVGGMREDRKGK